MQEIFVKRNLVAFVIKIIGLIIIGWGFIQGLIVATQMSQPTMVGIDEWGMTSQLDGSGVLIFLTIILSNAIYGILIIGFGEVIDLLQRIHDQKEPQALTSAMPKPVPALMKSIPVGAEQEIKEFYAKMNMNIESIEPTKHRDVFMVKVEGRVEYLELGSRSPQLLSEEEARPYL